MKNFGCRLCLVLVLAAAPAAADKELAREHFKKGMAAYTLDDFDSAIQAFQAGFREEPDPVFLYNIAQAHRLAHRPGPSLEFYRKYLRMSPKAKNRGEVEQLISSLEKTMGTPMEPMTPPGIKAGPADKPVTPVIVDRTPVAPRVEKPAPRVEPVVTSSPAVEKPRSAPPLVSPPVAVDASPAPTATTPALAIAPVPTSDKTAGPPKRRMWPVWVGVGAGVVVLGGGAAAIGVIATRGGPSDTVLPVESARTSLVMW